MIVGKGPGLGQNRGGGWGDAELSTTLDALPDGVLVVVADGRVEAANRAFLDLIGRALDEVLGQHFESLVAEEDLVSVLGFAATFAERSTSDNNVMFAAPDGGRRVLSVCSVRSEDDRRVIMTARRPGILQDALASASRWASSEQERARELARAHDALAAKNTALLAAQAQLESAYAKLRDEAATRERLEGELRLAQRLEAIGQLAAGVAHEINTPMQYIGDNVHFLASAFRNIASYLDIVKGVVAESARESWAERHALLAAAQKRLRLPYLEGEVPKALSASRQGIEHVSRIVQAMKSFAHQDQDEMTDADINGTLRTTLTVAQNEYKDLATIELDLGDLPAVCCYVGRLNHVFLNLIVNAAQAIEDRKRAGLGVIRVSSRAFGDWVEILIADDGCGIPEQVRHQVFDQFFTTKQVGRGSGQGLSLARSIVVEAHGGTLSFETEVGVGTTFVVRLPVLGLRDPAVPPQRSAVVSA